MTIFYLSDLQPNDTAYIYKVCPTKLSDRLYDMGFFGGTTVECVAAAPLNGPKAYLIRGAVIALRREDAKSILVEKVPPALENSNTGGS